MVALRVGLRSVHRQVRPQCCIGRLNDTERRRGLAMQPTRRRESLEVRLENIDGNARCSLVETGKWVNDRLGSPEPPELMRGGTRQRCREDLRFLVRGNHRQATRTIQRRTTLECEAAASTDLCA